MKNRRHGVHNPNAMFRKEVTAEEVLASRLVCEPLHLWMLCSPNEGAAAVVLQRDDGATPRRARSPSARLRSHLPGSVLGEATPLSGIDDTDITPPSTLAARDAYDEAGIGPDDIDVVECQDTDAARELLAYARARPVRARRTGAPARRRRRRARRRAAGQPERRAALEGRTARRVRARPGRRARAPAARRGGRAPGRRRTRRPRPHRRARRQRVLRHRDRVATAVTRRRRRVRCSP